MLARREAVIEPLLVIDEERGRLLLLERRQAGILPALPAQLDVPRDDLAHGQSGSDLIKDVRSNAHRYFSLEVAPRPRGNPDRPRGFLNSPRLLLPEFGVRGTNKIALLIPKVPFHNLAG